jgi:hypothetical protein
LNDRQLACTPRLEVRARTDDAAQFAAELRVRVQRLRKRLSVGTGPDSARVLLGYLVSEVLFLSGRRHDRQLSRSAALSLLGTESRVLATALGHYDWGRHAGSFPVFERVPRPNELDAISAWIPGTPARGSPRLLALIGFSGIGKSTLAASFAELAAQRYERIIWFDASSEDSLKEQVSRLLGLGGKESHADVSAALREHIGRSAESWLVVFDNAANAQQVAPWICPNAHLDVIATSTSTGSWSAWRRLEVLPMDHGDALEMVRVRLGLRELSASDTERATTLVSALDHWPLAIELACSFLVQSGRRLSITQEYLALVRERVIDDEDLTPAGYRSHKTLLRAIEVALDRVAETGSARYPQFPSPTDVLDALAYLPPRQAPSRLAAAAALLRRAVFHAERPTNGQFELWLDDALRHLSRSSLVHVESAPTLGQCTRMNSIVADVILKRQPAETSAQLMDCLQMVVGEALPNALDAEDFRYANGILSSCNAIVSTAMARSHLTRHGLITLGNMANIASLVGDHRRALMLFETELKELGESDRSSVLQAKIHCSILACQLALDVEAPVISRSVEAAVSACERAAAADDLNGQAIAVPMSQIVSVLDTLEAVNSLGESTTASDWKRRLSVLGFVPSEDPLHALHVKLSQPENDDAATLASMLERLANVTGVRERLQLQFAIAEATALTRDFERAGDLFAIAIRDAQDLGLGLGMGWVDILNAWRGVALALLSGDTDPALLAFGALFESLVGEHAPSSDHDRAEMAVILLALCCQTGPAPVVEERLRHVDQLVQTATLRAKEVSALSSLERGSRAVVRLRQSVGWASIVGLTAWRRIGSRDQSSLFLAAPVAEDWEDMGAVFAQGRWILAESGVGLHVLRPFDRLIWGFGTEEGWLGDGMSPAISGAARLRHLIMTELAPPTLVSLITGTSGSVDGPWELLARDKLVGVTEVVDLTAT